MSQDSCALDVLVVEDDEGVAQCMREILRQAGHVPTIVCTLQDARMHLAVSLPHVVTLDLDLGNSDRAISLLEELGELADRSEWVIVSASRFACAIAKDFGVALVMKPFDVDVLVAAVEHAGKNAAATQSVRAPAGTSCCEPSSLPPPFVGAVTRGGSGRHCHVWTDKARAPKQAKG